MGEFESVGSEENVFRDKGADMVVSAVVLVVVVVVTLKVCFFLRLVSLFFRCFLFSRSISDLNLPAIGAAPHMQGSSG